MNYEATIIGGRIIVENILFDVFWNSSCPKIYMQTFFIDIHVTSLSFGGGFMNLYSVLREYISRNLHNIFLLCICKSKTPQKL